MSKNAIIAKIASKANYAGLVLKKHSPEILLATGIVGLVASGVLACIATTKTGDILEETKEKLDIIHEKAESENKPTVEETRKETAIVYAQTGLKFVRLYAPAVAIGTLSIVSILASHNIMNKRNVALSAAYAAVAQDFKGYRDRVIDKFGEQVDRELKYNIHKDEVEEQIVDPETGEVKTVKKEIEVGTPEYSAYARCFDECSALWEKDAELNLLTLRAEQNYANERLRTRGYLFLNEIYERLDLPVSKAGAVVGWIYNPDDPECDSYVDFDIYDLNKKSNRDFVNGYERCIWLDFNVDGVIYDKIEKIRK